MPQGAADTIAAEMAFMFMERNAGRSSIDYPMGGSASIVAALVRCVAATAAAAAAAGF